MTLLCAATPDFLYAFEARHHDDWRDRPVVLIGADGRVWAASPLALASGAEPGLSLRQAHARCPDALTHTLDLPAAEAAQAAFINVLAATGMPVEPQGYGVAYCDLSAVAASPHDARPICADLGARIRHELGVALAPALGVDHSKFTARAAAHLAKPGSMRLVNREDEAQFLTTQPVTLLPLPIEHVRQLRWLGLRTLGEYAQLPVASVAARFGKAGVLAQRWARGNDDRPVRALAQQAPETVCVDFETPCASIDAAVSASAHALLAPLHALAEQLEGCRRVQLQGHFLDGSTSTQSQTLANPTCQPGDVRVAVTSALQKTAWPAELVSLRVQLLDIAELLPQTLTLFGDAVDMPGNTSAPFGRLASKLGAKHPGAFYKADVTDAAHPIAERRVTWTVADTHDAHLA